MKEIEVKILDINPRKIRRKLQGLGAVKVFQGNIESLILDFNDQRISSRGECLRLRKVGTEVELCYKGKKGTGHYKIREETEVTASDYNTTLQILRSIGLTVIETSSKKRESYQLKNVTFDIDFIPSIPPYLEIEAPTKKLVQAYVQKLGYAVGDMVNWSMGEVLRHYQSKK